VLQLWVSGAHGDKVPQDTLSCGMKENFESMWGTSEQQKSWLEWIGGGTGH